MARGSNKRKFDDHLPPALGKKFLSDLRDLLQVLKRDEGFPGTYLAEQCFSKYCETDSTGAEARRHAAVTKWLLAESRNAVTNTRIQFAEDKCFGWTSWETIVTHARKTIVRILGPLGFDPQAMDGNKDQLYSYGSHLLSIQDSQVLQTGTFTNGASTRVKRGPTAAIDKLVGRAHGSARALTHWHHVVKDTRLDVLEVSPVEWSSLFTVPKSADIDRVACKEPEINMFLQKSVGNHIRLRLRQVASINLNDQSINRELARTAVKRNLATIDLSSASDTITVELVRALLPHDWFSLLDDIRVKRTRVPADCLPAGSSLPLEDDGSSVVELNMFSSMGNGFTFELESLIFYALTRAVCGISKIRGKISVYGDDIIAPSKVVPRLARIFSFAGFKFNMKKTCWTGLFRESCGGHYYDGADVTPFYVKGPVTTVSGLILVLNKLAFWSCREWGGFLNTDARDMWVKWRSHVPKTLWGGQPIDSWAFDSSLITGDRPRMRIEARKSIVQFDQDAGLTYWLTSRRLTELPLACEPSVEGRAKLVRQPGWLVRTASDPLIYLGDGTSGGHPA